MVDISPDIQEKLTILLHELKAWNEKTNLTAIRGDAEIIKKHFLDSLSVLEAIPLNAEHIIDIGTGAGFPGLIIALKRPQSRVTLIDAVQKKIDFVSHCIQALGLTNAVAIHARAEALAHDPNHREQYEVATARAVALLPTLAEYTLPFVQLGGVVIAQKNAGDEEVSRAQHAIEVLGGAIKKQIPVTIEDLEPRQLIIIEKVHKTPSVYPRSSGTPTKKPL